MKSPHKVKLNELQATAISGNDISSSCLYVSALTIMYAGQYAWVSLLVVALVLLFFRKIYGEVVGALPLNGGAYNVLLNTTTKRLATLAATLTILSYMATAVISAIEAMHYMQGLFSALNVTIATIVLLVIFMGLAIIGIGESAIVAVVIFILHIATLLILVFASIWFVITHGLQTFHVNWSTAIPSGSFKTALYFGFAAGMLGISGFETSANFVEEQEQGVFRKTLRNMWAVVSFFNPVIALLVIGVLPLAVIGAHKETLLAYLGSTTAGKWLEIMIYVDATLVLSGAVLTSFVGMTGLAERITLDRILPNFFLKKNKRGSNYRIIIAFFILCVSVLYATDGDLEALAGVYTFSFLAVMALFGAGNLLLKSKRKRLPRPEYAKIWVVVAAIGLVITAFIGNIEMNTDSFYTFLRYLVPAFVFLLLMLNRSLVLTIMIETLEYLYSPLRKVVILSNRYLNRMQKKIHSQEFVFFTKGDDVATLNKVMHYVETNETTKRLKIVNVKKKEDNNDALVKDIRVLDRAYPNIDIEFVEIIGVFGPDIIEDLSKGWDIPKNFMFIGSPGNRFSYRVAELGGVRLIM